MSVIWMVFVLGNTLAMGQRHTATCCPENNIIDVCKNSPRDFMAMTAKEWCPIHASECTIMAHEVS